MKSMLDCLSPYRSNGGPSELYKIHQRAMAHHKTKHDRLPSSTRLDVVTMMLTSRPSAVPQQTSRYHSMVDLRPDAFTNKSGTIELVLSAKDLRSKFLFVCSGICCSD